MLPDKIGRYRIKAELGRGGMSTVFLAHDPHFDRDVAVKLLPRELLHHGNFRRRFEREAKIVASLDHPAIVPVHDFGEQDGQPFLIMRFMAGGSLTDRLKQGAMSIKEASRLISRLAPALDEVHQKNILHRDLKPSNILFDHRNEPFISDFGTAKFTFEHTKLTETGGAVGTPAYMSPEQIQGEANLDGRSDIYSLGVILFEILSGKHPFETNTPIGLAVKHIFEPIPSINEIRPELPKDSQHIIAKAMAKNPDDRYQTAVSLANHLTKIAEENIESAEMDEAMAEETAIVNGRRYALLIHTDTYNDPFLAQLNKPRTNTKKLTELLKDPLIGGFDEVTCITNESGDDTRRFISRFYADKNHDDMLLMYISGHAALDGNGQIHFASKTTDHELIRATSISGVFLADEMDGSRTQKQAIILDCYFSKVLLSDRRPTQHLPGVVGKAIDTSASFSQHGQDRLMLSASDSIHYVWQGNGVSGSPAQSRFSEFFIEGLESGGADVDHDGIVTINELYEYIEGRVIASESNHDNRHIPRKWSDDDTQQVVVAKNPKPSQEMVAKSGSSLPLKPILAKPELRPWFSRAKQKLFWVGTFVVIGIFLIVGSGDNGDNGRSTILAADAPTNTPAPTLMPTKTPMPTLMPTNPPVETPVHTATKEVATAVATQSPANTPEPITSAPEVLVNSSIFTDPDPESDELTVLEVTDEFKILGRSENGNWFYILNNEAIAGYVFGTRIKWDGEFETLPIVPSNSSSNSRNNCTDSDCQPLGLDLYPLPDKRCEGEVSYRTIYMLGQGGNGRYTYYWNGEKLEGPINEGFGFEVNDLAGDPVIGKGKVVSGDGQTIEKEIYVTDFSCGD